MNTIKLKGMNLSVFPLCLGTVNYGTNLSVNDSKNQLSQYIEMGGNFIDGAHIYGDWEPGLRSRSERTIGEWIQETGHRDKVIIATKGSHPDWGKMDIPRLKSSDIEKDLNESLEYLNTDYIDLYFLHRDDKNMPVSDIIDCLDKAQKNGKIRYYGCSNWSLKRIKEAEDYCKQTGRQGFKVNQIMWSLADINFYNLSDKSFILMDNEMYKYHTKTGMNVMAYMSVAKGYFTRRFSGEKLPDSVTSVYNNPTNEKIYERCLETVKKGNYTFMDLSLMYFRAEKAFPSVPIASFDNEKQLIEGISSCKKSLPTDLLHELGKIKKQAYYE
jgi:aryl-alcohol dehydrogenase-like predicted oxidoreductase